MCVCGVNNNEGIIISKLSSQALRLNQKNNIPNSQHKMASFFTGGGVGVVGVVSLVHDSGGHQSILFSFPTGK